MDEKITQEQYDKMPNGEKLGLSIKGFRCPRISHISDKRLLIRLSVDDQRKVRLIRGAQAFGEGTAAQVTDLQTGKRYLWEAAPCSLSTCYCDAVITEVAP